MIRTVKLPVRDVEKRALFAILLGIGKKASRRLTCEEMEDIAIKRGLLEKKELPDGLGGVI